MCGRHSLIPVRPYSRIPVCSYSRVLVCRRTGANTKAPWPPKAAGLGVAGHLVETIQHHKNRANHRRAPRWSLRPKRSFGPVEIHHNSHTAGNVESFEQRPTREGYNDRLEN